MVTLRTILSVLTTTTTAVYTCPSGKSAIVKMLQVSNINITTDYWVTVFINDGTSDFALAFRVNVPASGAVALLTGDLYLQPGYAIRAQAEAASNLVLVGSVVEL